MSSEALLNLDRNTAMYMGKKRELESEKLKKQITLQAALIDKQDAIIAVQSSIITDLQVEIAKLKGEISE